MKRFIEFHGEKTSVLICLEGKRLINWCEFDNDTAVCAFHDNSIPPLELLNGRTLNTVTYMSGIARLKDCAVTTAKTSAGRYSDEIEAFIGEELNALNIP